MKYVAIFAHLFFSLALSAMERNIPWPINNTTLPNEIIENHIFPNLTLYENKNFIFDQAEDLCTPYHTTQGLEWHRYGYMSNKHIFSNKIERITIDNEDYLHRFDLFKPLNDFVDKIDILIIMSRTSKKNAQTLHKKVVLGKFILARFILANTDYESLIFNMQHYKESNHFFTEPIHYKIANAIGNYFVIRKNIPEYQITNIKLLMIWTLEASKNTYNNIEYHTQKREPSMPADLQTNERLNRFAINLFKGIPQPLKEKTYTLQFETFRSKSGPHITDEDYIKNTANRMGLDLKISFNSFFFKTPDVLKIEFSQAKSSTCSIQ